MATRQLRRMNKFRGNLYVEKDLIIDNQNITKLIEDKIAAKISALVGILQFDTALLKSPVSNLQTLSSDPDVIWSVQGPPGNQKFLQCDLMKEGTLVKGAWDTPSRGQAAPDATVLAGKDVFHGDATYNHRIFVEFKGAAELDEFLHSGRELRVDYVFVKEISKQPG